MKTTPIFVKVFETTVWILEHTKKFPKHQRFVMAQRIEETVLTLNDKILYATKVKKNSKVLFEADYQLERLRLYARLCEKMKLLSFKQYEYLSEELNNIGKQLGGWIKSSTQSG